MQSQSVRIPVATKPVVFQQAVALPPSNDTMQVSSRTLAVFEVSGDAATGEIDVRQLPIIGLDGQPKQNELFTQTGRSCDGCNNPTAGSCTRTIRFDVDYEETATRYICDANIVLYGPTSNNVTSISNPYWEATPLVADLTIPGTTTTTYFTFDALVTDCTENFRVYVNLEGDVSENPCARLEFELTWASGNIADLDLRVDGPDLPDLTGPCQYQLSFYNPAECNGIVDLQCNGVDFLNQCGTANQDLCADPLELLVWDPVVHSGDYNVFAWAFALCGEATPIPYTIRVFLNGVQQGSDYNGNINAQQYWYTQDTLGVYIPLFTYTHP